MGSRGHTWIWVRRAQGRAARAEGQGQRLTGHSLGPGGHSPATSPGGSPPAPGAPCSRPHTRGSTVGDTSHLSASQDPYPRWSSQNITLEGTLGILFRFLPGDKGKQVERPGTYLLRTQDHTAWPPDPGGLHMELDNSWSEPPGGRGLGSPGHPHGAPSLVSPLLCTGLHLPFSGHHSAARLAPGPLLPFPWPVHLESHSWNRLQGHAHRLFPAKGPFPGLLCVFSSSLTHPFGSHYVRVFILKSDCL